MTEPVKKPKGFAAMTPERRREIASAGGKAAQREGRAHRFTTKLARAAGIKSAEAKKAKREKLKRPS